MDILLNYSEGYSKLELDNNDLVGDTSLYTAVVVSLFTDKRAQVDELPIEYKQGEIDLRGYFGDVLLNESIGSKLWLLKREKQLNTVLVRAQKYAEEALQWLIAAGYCKSVVVVATNPKMGWLNLHVSLELFENQNLYLSKELNTNWNFMLSFDNMQ